MSTSTLSKTRVYSRIRECISAIPCLGYRCSSSVHGAVLQRYRCNRPPIRLAFMSRNTRFTRAIACIRLWSRNWLVHVHRVQTPVGRLVLPDCRVSAPQAAPFGPVLAEPDRLSTLSSYCATSAARLRPRNLNSCCRSLERDQFLRQHEAVRRAADFAPSEFRYWIAREKRTVDRREVNTDVNCAAALGQIARDQKLIVSKTPV